MANINYRSLQRGGKKYWETLPSPSFISHSPNPAFRLGVGPEAAGKETAAVGGKKKKQNKTTKGGGGQFF